MRADTGTPALLRELRTVAEHRGQGDVHDPLRQGTVRAAVSVDVGRDRQEIRNVGTTARPHWLRLSGECRNYACALRPDLFIGPP